MQAILLQVEISAQKFKPTHRNLADCLLSLFFQKKRGPPPDLRHPSPFLHPQRGGGKRRPPAAPRGAESCRSESFCGGTFRPRPRGRWPCSGAAAGRERGAARGGRHPAGPGARCAPGRGRTELGARGRGCSGAQPAASSTLQAGCSRPRLRSAELSRFLQLF